MTLRYKCLLAFFPWLVIRTQLFVFPWLVIQTQLFALPTSAYLAPNDKSNFIPSGVTAHSFSSKFIWSYVRLFHRVALELFFFCCHIRKVYSEDHRVTTHKSSGISVLTWLGSQIISTL